MRRCDSCDFWFTPSSSDQATCPRCGQREVDLEPASPTTKVPVARAANWAEAGFFEDLLEHHAIHPEFVERDEFDALLGSWQPRIVMLVSEADAERAADLMEKELGEENDSSPQSLELLSPRASTPAGPFWRPVIFLLLASGLTYWVATRVIARPLHRRPAGPGQPGPRTSDLWDEISRSGGPWHQTSADGTRRLLWRDGETRSLHLKEDADGDGRYDRWMEFREGRKVRDLELTPFFSGPEPAF